LPLVEAEGQLLFLTPSPPLLPLVVVKELPPSPPRFVSWSSSNLPPPPLDESDLLRSAGPLGDPLEEDPPPPPPFSFLGGFSFLALGLNSVMTTVKSLTVTLWYVAVLRSTFFKRAALFSLLTLVFLGSFGFLGAFGSLGAVDLGSVGAGRLFDLRLASAASSVVPSSSSSPAPSPPPPP